MNPVSAGFSVSVPGSPVPLRALLERVADGRLRSRSALADGLGLGVGELGRVLDRLKALGLDLIESPAGIRLAEPIVWLDERRIEASLDPQIRQRIESIERFFDLESTNRHLLERSPPESGLMRVAVAEYQHGGRGRRGRRWTMPPGTGIAFSAAWRFDSALRDLPALSLAVGAAARRAIHDVVGLDVGLKWPNDLVVDGGKLGGILVEQAELRDGGSYVVAGIGLNVGVPETVLAAVSDWPGGARDLARAAQAPVDRSRVVCALTERLVELFAGFAAAGFEPYRAEWLTAHVLDGAAVELRTDAGIDNATVLGIAGDGALLVRTGAGRTRRILSGDVTLRGKN